MKKYAEMTKAELQKELAAVQAQYDELKARKLSLNMARGKPSKAQLDMSAEMMDILRSDSDYMCDGIDVRNYGNLEGLPSCRKLFAELLGVQPENVFIGGSASLQLMYDTIAKCYTHGRVNSDRPWGKLDTVKWLCPAPGYDRHFKVSESFGMQMITVPMTPAGPDMDLVEELIRDPEVKGMWCVPKYSNPQGITYSDKTVRRLAALRPAAPDFVLMWDNAYCVHEFAGPFVDFPDILALCRAAGRPDMVYEFASTSKITYPGAGVGCLAASEENIDHYLSLTKYQIISYDKLNQLRHVRFLKSKEGVLAHMRRHAAILAPKFACVEQTLSREIGPLGLAEWSHPTGGYFVSVDTLPGLAKRTWELCRGAGLTLTAVGATFPGGKDPADRNLRIAPSYPGLEELRQAMSLFCLCLKLAAAEQALG